MLNLEKMTLENLKFENLKVNAKMSATVLMLVCDVIFSGILLFATYGEIRLQAAEKKSGAIAADTLGSCHVSCLLGGKVFDPKAVKCLPDLTFEHCKRLETEDVTLYCPQSQVTPVGKVDVKLVAKFSTRPCN